MAKSDYDHVQMIKSQDDWPRWPILPVKMDSNKWDSSKGTRPIGVIFAGKGDYDPNGEITVYLTSMFQPIKEDTPKHVYPNAEAIVADGWVVD